ncbi:MAG: glycosyltransferase family 4 protein [Gemmataceae bacterium]|nr:glycosyltransferase family 4 protein [Gemmataceae bacterium]
MRVILNGVSALKPKTGVGHTTANLHRALTECGEGDSYWLYPGERLGAIVRWALRRGPGACAPGDRPPPLRGSDHPSPGGATDGRRGRKPLVAVAKAAYRLHFRAAARLGRFDLYHEPNFVPIPTHLPTVVTVHDLSVILHPEWHPADRVAFHHRHFRRGLDLAEHVIVVSESVRREVIGVLGVRPDRVTAIHNGIGGQYRPQPPEAVAEVRRRLGLPPRYALAVGTIEPRKNILTLLRAFCDLPPAAREACPLVLAGGWGWKSGPERELFETEARARGAIHLGYVADADLPGLYAGAAALLYPSFYEGFGLPPVEMLACGGGVVASTAAAVREVVGGHARLIDPHDLAGWRDALRRVATDADYLTESRQGGVAHARRFTWESAAGRTREVYRQVLGLAPATLPRAAA